MKFEKIFKEAGLYVTESFAEGVCFEVTKDKILKIVTYRNANDINPFSENAMMYGGLLTKTYKQVFNRQSLFNPKIVKHVKDFFLDMEKYEEQLYCNECGNDKITYMRSVSNGECWWCENCKKEIITSHKPNEDDY